MVILSHANALINPVHLRSFFLRSRSLYFLQLYRFRCNVKFHLSDYLFLHQTYSRHPTLRWAQTSDRLFITIDIPDAQDVKLKLEPEGKFFFSAIGGAEKIPYEIDIDLYDKVDINV